MQQADKWGRDLQSFVGGSFREPGAWFGMTTTDAGATSETGTQQFFKRFDTGTAIGNLCCPMKLPIWAQFGQISPIHSGMPIRGR